MRMTEAEKAELRITVGDLIKRLSDYPDDCIVNISSPIGEEFLSAWEVKQRNPDTNDPMILNLGVSPEDEDLKMLS